MIYTKPEIEVLEFTLVDVIQASSEGGQGGNTNPPKDDIVYGENEFPIT